MNLGNSVHSAADKKEAPPVLPNFLIVGAAKCGTSSLYQYLNQHPDVYMGQKKEPKFLSARFANPGAGPGDEVLARSTVASFEDYCGLFAGGVGRKAVGEASVDTLYHLDRAIPAIKRHLGDPRIIILLRDPVMRAYSAYNHQVRQGYEDLPFPEALRAEAQRAREGYAHIWMYRDSGLYANRVRAFQENFSRVQVLFYDDLKKDAASLLRSVYAFLEIAPDFDPDMRHRYNVAGTPRWPVLNMLFVRPKRLHTALRTIGRAVFGASRWVRLRERLRSAVLQKPLPMDPATEQELRQFYREDILKLQEHIGRDLSAWLEGPHR